MGRELQPGYGVDEAPRHPAGAEEIAEPLGGYGIVTQHAHQRSVVLGGGHEQSELLEPEVGVGGGRQPVEQQRECLLHEPGASGEAGREFSHGAARAADVAEPQRRQLPRHTFGGEGHGGELAHLPFPADAFVRTSLAGVELL